MRSHLWLVAALLAGAATPVLGMTAACAGTDDRAALVVDTQADSFTYCVVLPDEAVSGLELIELANEQHGLPYRFGNGGQAVCMLANVGAEGDDCFGEYPDFWGYWRGDGDGGWNWSSVGAGSTLVEDGDVEGWAWGSGQDGSTHPQPPPTRFGEVCPPAAASAKESNARQDNDRSSSRTGSSAASAPAGATEGAVGTNPQRERKASGRTEEPPQKSDASSKRLTPRTATASGRAPGAVADKAQQTSETGSQGAPTAGFFAAALIAALGAGGALVMRRRRH